MSLYSPITPDMGWVRHERKQLRIQVRDDDGDPVDLSGIQLDWVLTKRPTDETVLLRKRGNAIQVAGGEDEIAVIDVGEDDYAAIPAGVHWHELWDRASHNRLAHGEAYLHPGAGPGEES